MVLCAVISLLALFCVWIPGSHAVVTKPSIEPPPKKFPCPGFITAMKGEKGSTGPPGQRGQPGPPGMNGAMGKQGAKGDQGQDGKNGQPGIKGKKGEEGKCDALCTGIKKLETRLQALETNYTGELKLLKQKIVLLERDLNHALGSEHNPAVSCKAILNRDRNAANGPYYIKVTGVPGNKILVYCIMNERNRYCPKGLTQVMKIDGSKGTFKFSSPYWTNKKSYNPAGGMVGCDYQETKLPTYWSTPFTKICIRMRVRGKWIVSRSLTVQGNSLYDLIADGKFRPTHLGRSGWKALLRGSSLQSVCSKEGFNVRASALTLAAARIGIIADEKANCPNPDSYIGFGTAGSSCKKNPNTSCGNEAGCGGDNGNKHIQAHGYIYVY